MTNSAFKIADYDAVMSVLQLYIDGCKHGKSAIMRSAFQSGASSFGFVANQLASGTEFLFDWIDRNGPAEGIQPSITSVAIVHSLAVAQVEVTGWSGKLAGAHANASDIFTLLKGGERWMITHKLFHWHVT